MKAAPRWRVISDGTPTGTRVYRDGEPVDDVVAVSWSIRADDVARVTLELEGPNVDVNLDGTEEPPVTCGWPLHPPKPGDVAPCGIRCELVIGHDGDHADGCGNRWSA